MRYKRKGSHLAMVLMLVVVTLVSCSSNINSSEPIFLVQKEHDYAYPSGEVEGTLILDDNYLRLITPAGGTSYLLVWPYGFLLNIMGDKIQVINAEGKAIAQVGDDVWIGGGEVPAEIIEKYTGRSVPEHYKEPYWLVAEF